jgi:hypothetical protein
MDERIQSVIDAASVLTAIGVQEHHRRRQAVTNFGVTDTALHSCPESKHTDVDDKLSSKKSKRFLPFHKKPDAALTFPEKVGCFVLIVLS